jgi:hypothetical protein
MQEELLRTGEETLPDARSDIKEVIIGNLLLVIRPDLLFTFLLHNQDFLKSG